MSWDALTRYFSLVEGLGTVVAMATADPGEGRITRERYWQLVADGTIGPDDRVELLEGVKSVASERRYAERMIARAGDRLEPLGLPGVAITVADILPPRPS